MEHFLELVAKNLLDRCSDSVSGLSNVTVVLPNRRARLFFDEYLSRLSGKPIWSPSYMTIDELFQSLTDLETADPYRLVSVLYNIYKDEMHSTETPDSFWSWGELMIRDFDDIDRNMADAAGLFACLQNHRELEGKPFLSEEQTAILQSFFDGFSGDTTQFKRKYMQIWNALGPIYDRLRRTLRDAGIAYEGMLQREVAENFDAGQLDDRIYAFVGFNSLDKAEKTLFRKIRECGKALFYWDYDESYIEDKTLEASLFLRENMKEFPNMIPKEHFKNLQTDKKLTIVEASSDNAQARYIPKWLESLPGKPDKDTAIVLCDSNLLQPVLHSIPSDKAGSVNITMGFPLSSIPLCGFVTAILDIQRLTLKNSGKLTIAHVGRVLCNPLTERISPNASAIYQELKKTRQYYPDISSIETDDALREVFTPCEGNLQLIDKLLAVLRRLAPTFQSEADNTVFQPLYSEGLYRIYTQASRFRTLIEDGSLDIGTEMLCRLLRKVITSTSVPFHGEPVVGMQVMGLLETRNLDFRNILLLSAAEGTLPSGAGEASFIPFSIRNAFGLTTMLEKSAVSSYNFHHLLERAENVTMVYNGNTDATGIGKGQISRYLLQLIVSGRPVRRISLEPEHSATSGVSAISAVKDGEVMRRLAEMYDINDRSRYISPSAINCYLDCGLRYYLKYLAGIRAKDNDPSEIDASLFGTLFHLSAELAYNELAAGSSDGTVTAEMLDRMIADTAKTRSFVREAFRRELFNGTEVDPGSYNGVQTVNFNVIHSYLKQMLRYDKVYAPFRYLGSEAKDYEDYITIPSADTHGDEIKIRISGRIDRMDCKGGIYRIADYKTGHVEESPKSMDDLFEGGKARRKYALQTFYYAAIVHSQPEFRERRLAPVLLYIRQSANPTEDDIYMKMGGEAVTDFAGKYLDEYRKRLQETIAGIFDPTVPFSQTDDVKTCEFCDFRSICHR